MEMTILINRGNRNGERAADKAGNLRHISDPREVSGKKTCI
jgi:hypothetical protein